jgi:hypothetical protein
MNDQNKPQYKPQSPDKAENPNQSEGNRRPGHDADADRRSPSTPQDGSRVNPDQGAKAPTTDQHGKRLEDPAAAPKPAGARDADTSARDHGRKDERGGKCE